MADSVSCPLKVALIQKPEISEEDARRIAGEWITENILHKKDTYRLGRAVMVYYPFWRYVCEDGPELITTCKPACGVFIHNVQTLVPTAEFVPANNEKTLPPSIDSSYYYPELYGIHREEKLVGIPFWLVSYKYQNSIYMLKLDASTGTVIPEWHPFKDPINWPKIAMLAGLPVLGLSMCGVFLHWAFFIIMVIYVIIILGYSRMLAILNTKRAEEEGDFDGA
ncbi:MAG TPA: hypothetical protein O0X27_03465 [Methanocorpusculum sp.]|nr:hypothetical protein [Methanocorpusculum sp.]